MAVGYEVGDWRVWTGGGRPRVVAVWGVVDASEADRFKDAVGQAATWTTAEAANGAPLLYLVLRGGTKESSTDLEYAAAPEPALLDALAYVEAKPADSTPVLLGFFPSQEDFDGACHALDDGLSQEALAAFERNSLFCSSFRVEPGTSARFKPAV
jgi:hypothetical protein